MFTRVFAIALAILPMLTLAAPQSGGGHSGGGGEGGGGGGGGGGSCNVGQLSCCNQVQQMNGAGSGVGGILNNPLGLLPLLGFNCNPISVIGIGGNNCAAQPVCCQQNYFTGLVNALNCSPINVGL